MNTDYLVFASTYQLYPLTVVFMQFYNFHEALRPCVDHNFTTFYQSGHNSVKEHTVTNALLKLFKQQFDIKSIKSDPCILNGT